MTEESKNKMIEFLHTCLLDAFGIFCVLYNILTIQVVWNWLVPKHLGLPEVSFAGVFVLQGMIRYLIIGNLVSNIRTIKKFSYLAIGIQPTSTTTEDWINFFESSIILGMAWFLIKIGVL